MFKSVFVLIAAASASTAAVAQTSVPAGRWTLEAAPNGCVVHAASPGGTVVSVWGVAGEDSLSFLVQNKSWTSFREGGQYDIGVAFDGGRAWQLEAVAKREIDKDGPGLTFAVSPSNAQGGARFLDQFAASAGMQITREGNVERVSLADSELALQGLAKCLRQVWASAKPAEADDEGAVAQVAALETI